MKTIQITIDDALLLKVDRVTHLKKIARSQFIRKALEDTLRQMATEELEQKQAELTSSQYRRQPVTPGEFRGGYFTGNVLPIAPLNHNLHPEPHEKN